LTDHPLSSVSALAVISPEAKLAPNTIVGAGVIIGAGVVIEAGVEIAAGVVFADGGAIRTTVCAGSRIGAGAVIGAGIELGRGCEISPGSAVLKSVPPNAIVEGNPARIVGYVSQGVAVAAPTTIVAEGPLLQQSSQPAIVPLGIGKSALHRMRRVADLRGALTVGEVEKDVPFVPRRYFIVFDVPSLEQRGEHAHRECHQFLICVRGACRILLDDGQKRCEVTLDRPDLGVYMPPMIWGTQYRHTMDAVILVFASHSYDAGDYLRTYDAFLSATKASRE
jgi:UDP-2-acetamido-3-amino-2,3-dideoxy-glucuronate N-acetyltransferase